MDPGQCQIECSIFMVSKAFLPGWPVAKETLFPPDDASLPRQFLSVITEEAPRIGQREPVDDATHAPHALLSADASPHACLYPAGMEDDDADTPILQLDR